MSDLITGLGHLKSMSSKVVVSDSQKIGPGIGASKNLVKSQLSSNDSDANDVARLRAAKLGQAFPEADDQSLAAADERIIDMYLDEIIEDSLGF